MFHIWPFERNMCGVLNRRDEAPWDLETWEKACQILRSMEGLEDLFVILRGGAESNSAIVGGLEYLTGVKVEKDKFRVRIPWPRVIARTKNDAVDRRLEDRGFPFHVFRPERVLIDEFWKSVV